MKPLSLLLICIFYLNGFSQQKSHLNINKNVLSKSSATSSLQIENSQLSLTMISGGYYTMGTNNGQSESSLDDQQTLTFGHPYAMTSYPLLEVDGSWHTMESFFMGLANLSPQSQNDTLSIKADIDSLLKMVFTILATRNLTALHMRFQKFQWKKEVLEIYSKQPY